MSDTAHDVPDAERPSTRDAATQPLTGAPGGMYDLLIQNQRLEAALNNISQGICFFDGNHRLILANRRYAEIYGLPLECIRPGTTLTEIVEHRFAVGAFPKMTRREYLDWRDSIATLSEPSDTVAELKNGRIISIHHRPMPDRGWVSTHEDVTEQRRMQERMEHLARHDPLTGLANRLMLREHMARLSDQNTAGETAAVLCLDIDHFKHVNDAYGHQIGDSLLCATAERLRGCVRESDFVVRCGGDEFAIIQIGADQPAQAAAVAERVLEVFRHPFQISGRRVEVVVSIGVAIGPIHESDGDKLLMNAELALYRAKADGVGTYRFFEPVADAKVRARHVLDGDLRVALEHDEFELFFQPKVNVKTLTPTGFEALLRWRHPVRGIVSPAEFIPLLEENGLILPVGEWVLRRACREATSWPESVTVAVNLSPVQFRTPHLVDTVRAALQASGLTPGRLELEITETALLRDTAETVEVLHKLRNLGVRISLDDFGTGYSSISYLNRFPFDKIKIDQSFVRGLCAGTKSLMIVQAIMNLATSLGISVVAEGVETSEQFAMLRAENCPEVQGYLFGMPVPAAEVHPVLSRFNNGDRAAA
jgi:diguanylate cyclase (GGDEF)-like protein